MGIILLAASGAANAYTRLDTPSQLVTTGYGQLIITKTLLIVVLGVFGWIIRSRVIGGLATSSRRSAFARIAGLDLLIMAVAVGLGVALGVERAPADRSALPTYGESLLGFPYPRRPHGDAWASDSTSTRSS